MHAVPYAICIMDWVLDNGLWMLGSGMSGEDGSGVRIGGSCGEYGCRVLEVVKLKCWRQMLAVGLAAAEL